MGYTLKQIVGTTLLDVPPVAMPYFVTAKNALKGLMKSLAAAYASSGLSINAVSPSMVETAFLEKLPARFVEIAAAQSPGGRHATADEVAGAISFLLSPDADHLSGADIAVAAGSEY